MDVGKRDRKADRALVVVHVVLAAVLSVGVVLALYRGEEPNIGAGLLLLPLHILALPWSLLPSSAVDPFAVIVVGALGNAALHAALPAGPREVSRSRAWTVALAAVLLTSAVTVIGVAVAAARAGTPLH